VFEEGELNKDLIVKEYLITAKDGEENSGNFNCQGLLDAQIKGKKIVNRNIAL
jgi:hypothetical protein